MREGLTQTQGGRGVKRLPREDLAELNSYDLISSLTR